MADSKTKNKRNYLVMSMFFSLLIVTIISALVGQLSNFLDGLFIARFYGDAGTAAYSIGKPIFIIMALFSGIISAGLEIMLSSELAKGNKDRANKIFNFFLLFIIGVGIIMLVIGLTLAPQLAFIFGATDMNSDLNKNASDYLKGVIIGAPFLFMYFVIIPALNFNGARKTIMLSGLICLAVNVLFDALNGLYFGWGMFGMGIATSFGYILAIVPMIIALFKKKATIKISFKNLSSKDSLKTIIAGLPSGTKRISQSLSAIFTNFVFVAVGGTIALSAAGVEGSIYGLLTVFSAVLPSVIGSLVSMLKQDEDKDSIKHLLIIMIKYAFSIVLVIVALVIAFAPYIVQIFKIDNEETINQSILAIRICSAAIPFMVINASYLGYLQGLKKYKLSHIFNILYWLVCPIIGYSIFAFSLGSIGLWIAVPASEILFLLTIVVFSFIRNKHISFKFESLWLFQKFFSSSLTGRLNLYQSDIISSNEYINKINNFAKQVNMENSIKEKVLALMEASKDLFPISKENSKQNFRIDYMVIVTDDCVRVRFRDNLKNFNSGDRAEIIKNVKENPEKYPILTSVLTLTTKIERSDCLNVHNIVFTL